MGRVERVYPSPFVAILRGPLDENEGPYCESLAHMTRDLGLNLVTNGCIWLGKVFLQLLLSVERLCAMTLTAEEETRKLSIGVMLYTQNKGMPWWIF